MELADTTAWAWSRRSKAVELRQWFDVALVDRDIATCDMVRLELLHTARNGEEFTQLRIDLDALPDCPIGKQEWERSIWVYERLAHGGGRPQHSVKHADLLIAAAAESAGVPILHYDEDYERIAAVTGQSVRWLAPKGSLR